MKIAVTGATGFIGRHVLKELSTRIGVDVIATSRGTEHAADVPDDIEYVAMDIGSPPPDAYDRLGRPDVLVHLAWSGLPNYKSLHHFEEHLAQQYRFLSVLVKGGLRSLTCTGTCFEYGMRSGELSEDMVADPGNPYGFAKDALRRQLSFLNKDHPFDFTWARLFYMFGAGQPASSLFTQFNAAVARGDRSFRMSGGEQLRDFLPVEAVANMIVALAIDRPCTGTVNVCSGKPISVRSLVERWRAEHQADIQLELGHYPYPDYEPMAFWGSDTRLRRALAGHQRDA